MRTFVVPDIHGRPDSLEALLLHAGVITEDGTRIRELEFECSGVFEPFQVISIGDLLNATLSDVNGDEACLLKSHWFDKLILGNHESGYVFENMGFNGYYPAPHLRDQYNQYVQSGHVVPSMLVGDTLLTHAGVHAFFEFGTALEAHVMIQDVWANYREYSANWDEKFYFSDNIEIPKALLLDAVSSKRGGGVPFGGILWADWAEPKNASFSQVMGHTPIKAGPVLTTYYGEDIFHLNIDCGAKKGLTPWGVWLDSDGRIDHVVTVPAPDTEQVAPSAA